MKMKRRMWGKQNQRKVMERNRREEVLMGLMFIGPCIIVIAED